MRRTMAAFSLVILCACSRQSAPPKDPRAVAEEAAKLATTPEQKRLLNEAAARAKGSGLEQLPRPETAVQDRKVTAPPSQSVATGRIPEIAPNVAGVMKVVSAPADLPAYTGPARIRSVEGQKIELELGGEGRTIVFVARVAGKPMSIRAGDVAQVEYRSSEEDPRDRQLIFAVRAPATGIVSVMDSDAKPVTVRVGLYDLIARQVGEPRDSAMDVEVRVGGASRILKPGEIAEVGELTVGIQASIAYEGADLYRIEGNPYALDLIAWPRQ